MYSDPTLQMMFKLLTFTGCNPTKGYRTSQIALFIISVSSSVANTFFVSCSIFKEGLVMNEILDALSGLFYTWQSASKTITMFYMKRDINMLFDQMETYFWLPKLEENDQRNKLAVSRKLARKTSYLYIMSSCGALIMYTIVPLVTRNQDLIFQSYIPTWISFEFMFIFQLYIGASHLVSGMLAFDMMFMIILTYTRGQFEMLNEELKCIFDTDLTKKEETQIFKSRMRACIKHHDFLMRYSETVSDQFSGILGIFFVFVFLCETIETYRMINETDILAISKSIVYVSASFVAISSMCFFIPAQLLQDEASKVCQNIYSSKWYDHVKLAKPIMMIVARSNNLVEIKPLGIWELNLKTALIVVKSMVSYATFLKTMEEAT